MFSRSVIAALSVPVVFDKELVILRNGVIGNIKTLEKLVPHMRDGVSYVYIKEKEYSLKYLLCIHFKDIIPYVEIDQLDEIEVFILDKTLDSIDPTNLGYRFKNGQLECKKYPNFYHIPEHMSIVMNDKDEYLNTRFNKFLIPSRRKYQEEKNIRGGYYIYNYNLNTKQRSFSRHRTKMMTFKGYSDDVDKMQINHIDGVGGNDNFNNLEWVTPLENITHAINNGLRSQNRPVISYNVKTGEYLKFPSIASCAKELGYSDMTVGNIVNKIGNYKATREGYSFKYQDEKEDWYSDDEIKENMVKTNEAKPLIVRCCKTLKTNIYPSISEAARQTNIESPSIKYRLNRDNFQPLFGYQFIYEGMEFPEFTEEEYLNSIKPNSYKIEARNLLTNETRSYGSIREMVKDLGKTTAPERLRKGQQPYYSDGWQIKTNGVWEEVKDPVKACKELINNIIATNVNTREEKIYSSARELKKTFGGESKTYRELALNNNDKEYKGHTYKLGVV